MTMINIEGAITNKETHTDHYFYKRITSDYATRQWLRVIQVSVVVVYHVGQLVCYHGSNSLFVAF